MAKIEKIKKGTATIYPATIPQAVIDPTSGKSARTELDEKANHGYESDPKTLKVVDDAKADHGYESNPKTLKEVDDEKAVHGYGAEPQKTLKEVDDEVIQLAGDVNLKELKANKQNSLEADGTGTKFPTVDAVNEGLNHLVASFTFNSNPEKIISAVDIATNTFTSVAHGMANGTQVCITKNQTLAENTNPVALIPGGLLIERNFVINATADTFQLSRTAGGAAIDIVTNETMNLSKIHLEILSSKSILVSNLPDSYGWRVIAKINSTINDIPISIRGSHFSHTLRWITNTKSTLWYSDVVHGVQSEFYANTVLQQIAGRNIISSKGVSVNYPSATTMATSKIDSELMDSIYTVPTFIKEVSVSNNYVSFYILNGSKIEIYKL